MARANIDRRYRQGSDDPLSSPTPSWATIAQMVETRPDGRWRLTELGLARAQSLAAHHHLAAREARAAVD